MNGKLYLVILCGAPDRPIEDLGNQTPLEKAETSNLDSLAHAGTQGLLTIIDGNICPESDSGILSLLGYDPHQYYTGRGGLEALGLGFMGPDEPNTIGFRINFASHNPTTGELDRRTARDLTDPELQELVKEVEREVNLGESFDYSIAGFGRHRGIVCIRSSEQPLSDNVTFTDPGFHKEGPFGIPNDNFEPRPNRCTALDESPEAKKTAALVNSFVEQSSKVLNSSPVNAKRRDGGKLPANVLLFRDGGSRVPDLPTFASRYGWSLSLYGQIPAEHGLCMLVEADWTLARKGENEDPVSYYADLVDSIVSDTADVVVVHLKAPDEPAHDGDPAGKVAALAELDVEFVARLRSRMGPNDACIFTSDHSTPCDLGIHSPDPVPAVVYAPNRIGQDDTERFSERSAAKGGLGVKRGPELLPHLHHIFESIGS